MSGGHGKCCNATDPKLKPTLEPPLMLSELMADRERRYTQGLVIEHGALVTIGLALDTGLAALRAGRWQCDLHTQALSWADPVYDLFGLPRGLCPVRATAVALYCEHSRVIMERLRSNAIRQGQAFLLDAELQPNDGGRRWMRLVAAPVREEGPIVRLKGLKMPL
jgi:PAS domain-containing protein